MKQQSTKYYILLLLVAVLVIPSVALAAWWNPFSWNWNIITWFSRPSTTQQQTQKPTDATTDWKTYTNTKYGYSIKYPTNWYINTQYSNLDLTPRGPNKDYIGGDTSISNYLEKDGMYAPPDYTLISWMFWKVPPISKERSSSSDFIKKENVVINGVKGIKTTILGEHEIGSPTKLNSVRIIFELNNGEELSVGYGFDNNNVNAAKVANQIISTFKFTTPVVCAKESEKMRPSGAGFPAQCCTGLKAITGHEYNNDCSINKTPPPGDIGTCIKCGDGKCASMENKCNCPQDCK